MRPGVLHSFSGDLPVAERAVRAHFLIGITGPVTFKKAEVLGQVAAGVPEEALLIETDAPFLTPHPHRGQRNEPAYVQYVAARIAELRGIEIEDLAKITQANAERLFHWE
jgi:TatD DNase family protein